MKIKVDKEEWENLLKRVAYLEDIGRYDSQYRRYLESHLQEIMEDYFKNKVQTYMVKRDREKIVAEVKKAAINNLFKENEDAE